MVGGDVEFGCNRKSIRAEKIYDERLDVVGFGYKKERLVDIGIVEAYELKDKSFMVERRGGRKSNTGEIVKGHVGIGGRDRGYVWRCGTSIVGCRGNEYVDGE